MKKIKKLAAFMLAMIMLLAMTLPVVAAPSQSIQKGNLTIKGTAAKKVYDLYRVLDLSYSDTNNHDNYSYTINSRFASFFTEKGITVDDLSKYTDNSFELSTLAQELLNYAITHDIDPDKRVTAEGESVTVSDIEYGYYLLNPLGGSIPNSNYATMFALNTLSGKNMEITVKAEYPTIDKNVADDNEEEFDKIDETSIGKYVDFKLKTKVPDTTGYKRYWFIINDILSKGLDFGEIKSIKIGDNGLTKDTNYTVESITNSETKETTLKIVFKEFKNYVDTNKIAAGTPIEVLYTARLNEHAVINGPNPNKVTLTYSNDPYEDYDGDAPDPKDPNPPVGVTPEKVTETYTTSLRIHKTDGDGQPLTGAAFQITGENVSAVVTKGDVYVEDVNGAYWLLKDGKYTQTDPNGEGVDKDAYEDLEKKYRLSHEETLDTKAEEPVDAEAYVDENGDLIFAGLGIGTYTITETVVPDGYNAIQPFNVEITFDNGTFTVKRGEETLGLNTEFNAYSTDVENNTGSLLPSTGGIGTTIFYIVGAILVIGAGIILVARKRMSHEQ